MTHLSDELIDRAAETQELAPNAHDHLARCAECRARVAAVQGLRVRLAALPRSLDPGSEAWPRIRRSVEARRGRRRTLLTSVSLALAAALLFAVVRVNDVPDASLPVPASNDELLELRGVVLPVVVDAMEANLTIYDAALRELEQHAVSEQHNYALRQRIDDLRRKRSALLRQASSS